MKKKRNEDKDMTKDFFEALDILEKERKISKEFLLKKIKDALAAAYKKETGLSNLSVTIDEVAGKIKICKVVDYKSMNFGVISLIDDHILNIDVPNCK